MSDKKNEAASEEALQENAAELEAETTAAAEEPAPEDKETALQSRIDELEKEAADLKDQYLRKAADFENFRKRAIREKQDAIDYANTNLLLDMITVIDDFERAIKAGDTAADIAAFRDGVVMIKDKFTAMLASKYNLAGYDSVGEAFDPNIHEALGRIPDPEVAEPVVGEEYLRGYKLKDRVVRAAKVMVKMPQEPAAAADSAEQPEAAEEPAAAGSGE